MEFPAGALTNVLTINGFSNIYWKILHNEDLQPQSPGAASPSPASNAALSGISRLKELELKLRNLRCLSAHISKSFGILIFSTEPNFKSIQSLYRQDDANSNMTISLGGSILRSSVTSSITSLELVKHLVTDPQTSLPINSGFQENSLGSVTPSSMEILLSYSIFYEAFISAITGAVSLDLARRHKLIPLGTRTFFTTTSQNSYEKTGASSDDHIDTNSILATLDIEMTFTGDLVVSLRAIHQPGLELLSADRNTLDSTLSQHNLDLWLAPNGAIARLMPKGGVKSMSISPGVSGVSNYGDEGEKRPDEASRKEWKQNVSQWLENFGISAPEADEESWVEVEVLSSFNVKPMNSGLRHTGLDTSQPAPKRILWPSNLCFKRNKSTFPSAKEFLRCFILPTEDPLDFAETWLANAKSRNKSLEETGSGDEVSKLHQDEQPKPSASSPHKAEVPEALDSLARTVNFPDFQSGNSVYPTPPDGTLVHNLGAVTSSDGIGASANDGTYMAMTQMQNDGIPSKDKAMPSSKENDVLMGGFGAQPSTYAIGSGLYDTGADDEDLFGGMDEANFGSKGITEADFNFFDEPDLGDLAEGIGITNSVQFPEQDQVVKSETDVDPPDIPSEATKSEELDDWKKSHLGINDPTRHRSMDKEGYHSPSVASNANSYKLPEDTKSQVQDRGHQGRPQTLSPPLSPIEIKKILFADQHMPSDHPNISSSTGGTQKRSHYGPIPFQRTLSYSDQKYNAAGKFWFPPEGINSQSGSRSTKDASDIPTVGLPKGGRKLIKSKTGYTPHTNADLSPTNAGDDEIDCSPSSSDESDDDSDALSDGGAPPTFLAGGLKRKRMESNLDESTTSSLEKLCLSNELLPSNSCNAEGGSKFLGNFLSGSVDWSFSGFFSLQESYTSPALVRRDNSIQLAQLLVDQITQSSFDHNLDGMSRLAGINHPNHSMHSLLQGGDIPGQASRLKMEDLITTPGPEATQSTNQKQTSSLQRNDVNGSIAKIPPPHIRIRRGNSYMEVLPPAIAFWETFGLEPAKGKKNIIAYCIHPHDTSERADAFLERIGLTYSSCNLGTHSRGSSIQPFDDGLVSWNVDRSEDTTYKTVMNAIKSICEVLGSILSKIPPSDDNILIYVVNPFSNVVAMADLCSAFLSLFQRYIGDVDRQHVRQLHEIVLQVIPIEFVSSLESIVVPPQVEYLNLALEVYSRCPPKDSHCDLAGSASALTLSKSPPKAIDFKLLPEQASPLQESRCLHVAYSLSRDQRWVTAAWTDKVGSFQMTMSYCLRNKGSSVSRLISSVRQEIWETSRDIMEKFQTRWKIFLVRDEPVEGEEVEAWVSFANQQNHTRPTKVELIILSADTNPGLALELSSQLPGGSLNNIQSTTGTMTPVATPSPDPTSGAANAHTPAEQTYDTESDTTLIDVSDETWGAILSRRLNNSHTLLEYHPALASGYLIRRKGITDNDGVVTMSINLVHVHQGHGVHCEALLRDILHMYRDLATLARAKGLSHVRHNTLPWHIASAVKGQEIMSYVL